MPICAMKQCCGSPMALQPKSSASANSAILASVWNAVAAPFRVRSKAPSYTRLACGKNDLRASRFG
jgi:hypothetical protein